MIRLLYILSDAFIEDNFNSLHLKLSAAEVSTVAIDYWSNNLGITWFVAMFYGTLEDWDKIYTKERNKINEESEKDK